MSGLQELIKKGDIVEWESDVAQGVGIAASKVTMGAFGWFLSVLEDELYIPLQTRNITAVWRNDSFVWSREVYQLPLEGIAT